MISKRTLRECSVFQPLTDDELAKILTLAVDKEYEAGTTIFQQGDYAGELFVIQEGKVALQMQLPTTLPQMSRSVTVDLLTTSDLLGWSAVVEPHLCTLTAICLQRVKVAAISGTSLKSALQDNPSLGYQFLDGLIKVVASRLDDTRRLLISERLWNPKPEEVGSL